MQIALNIKNSLISIRNALAQLNERLRSLLAKFLVFCFYQIGLRMAAKRYAWSRSVERKWFAVQLRRTQHGKSHGDIIAAVHAKFGQDLVRSTLSQWIKQGDAIEAQFNATGSNEAKRARRPRILSWSRPCSFGTRVMRRGVHPFQARS